MLRDVFYYGKKPNVHPREQYAENLEDARAKATTRDFWIINEFCDYRNFDWDFDFEFLPDEDVWAEDHNNVWPSQHQKDSGTWLCPKEHSDIIIYRGDVEPVIRKNERNDNWVFLEKIDESKFDFSWHPDPTDPPYIYKWGCKFFPAELKHVLEYVVPGATQEKYMNKTIELLPNDECWVEYDLIDTHAFDMSWRPDPLDPAFIYVWGNKWVDGRLKPTLEYHVPGATDKKYMPDLIAVLPEWDKWVEVQDVDKKQFDFSWRPDPREPAYIYTWGNKFIEAELRPTLEYHCEGATERKYMTNDVAVLPEWDRWEITDAINKTSFDFSWRPDPREPDFVYEFATQWQRNGGPRYTVPGATEIKYIDEQRATRLPKITGWDIPDNVDVTDFDFSWHPDNVSPPYIYQFPTQWALNGGPRYVMPGATEIKYEDCQSAKTIASMDNWEYDPSLIDVSSFDFSWHPYMDDQPYIYQFGTQWQKTGGPRYITPGATSNSPIKYVDTRIIKANRLPNDSNWVVLNDLVIADFDYSWHPDETESPYIYVFGNTQYPAQEMPTIQYVVEGATEIKYVNNVVATLGNNMTNWEVDENIDVKLFDFSWIPHPASPPYIYQFGTILDKNDGPRYITPNNNGETVYLERVELEEPEELVVNQYFIETTLEDLINEHPDEIFWAIRKNLNYDEFDFNWRPSIEQAQYIHAFGSADSEITQTYLINANQWIKGNRDINWVENVELTEESLAEIFAKPDMFFVDKGNSESSIRFEVLKGRFGNRIQKTRYLNSWVDTINRCSNRATSDVFWVLNSELDYTDFNFDYYPNPWQMKMVHVFGTQWSHWGTTFMVNRETFREDTKYIKIIEHLSNLNFVKNIRAKATLCVHDIVVIDHGNKELATVLDVINSKASGKNLSTVAFNNSYFETLKDIIKKQQEKKEHYIWICSSVCDYTDFDFSYICDPYARDQLHVFPSGMQKFGDTFFVDVNKVRELINDMEKLEDFHKVNFNSTVRAKRLPEPVIVTQDDTHVNSINNVAGFPYATLITSDNADVNIGEFEPMSLWTKETKNIIITTTGATRIVVPAEAKSYVSKELYEYPYIKRSPRLAISNPLDIVFLSNGETGAEENWEHLLNVTKNLKNRVVRVDGVNGRAAAYHAAAEASNTPWMFTVFAKLRVSPKFDWNWQPDRMQVPKHYIFHAKNPVNGLVYGHQAMIAYNKKLTLANEGKGLDFTLDDEHEVVPLISGTAMYNTDEFSTWRTAFREVIKLKADESEESKTRLNVWLNKAEGDFSEFSIKGALDAEEYYDEVGGDFDKLKLSYEWAWLRQRFDEL